MQPGRQAGATAAGLAQPGRGQRRRKKKIWQVIRYGIKSRHVYISRQNVMALKMTAQARS